MIKKMVLIGILCATVAILCQTACASGIGISPTMISVSDVIRGEVHEEIIQIHNPNDEEIGFILETSGQAGEWISFYDYDDDIPLSEGIIPPNDKQFVRIKIEIPSDTANGIYNARISASTSSAELTEDTSGMQAVFRASCDLTIDVTDVQKLSGTVDYITVRDGEVNMPLPIEVKFTNTGNVIAKPTVTIVIQKDGVTIDQFTAKDVEIKPGLSETIKENWDTAERKSGDYTADVSVSLGGTAIKDETIPFELFPVGTMTRDGEFLTLVTDGDLYTGTLLKVIGKFKNTGSIGTTAQMVGEVLKDGNLIGIIESKELEVSVYSSKELTSYLDLTDPGDYTVKAHVIYGGKETDEKELIFTVSEESEVSGPSAPSETKTPLSLIPTVSAILIAGLCMALRKKER